MFLLLVCGDFFFSGDGGVFVFEYFWFLKTMCIQLNNVFVLSRKNSTFI